MPFKQDEETSPQLAVVRDTTQEAKDRQTPRTSRLLSSKSPENPMSSDRNVRRQQTSTKTRNSIGKSSLQLHSGLPASPLFRALAWILAGNPHEEVRRVVSIAVPHRIPRVRWCYSGEVFVSPAFKSPQCAVALIRVCDFAPNESCDMRLPGRSRFTLLRDPDDRKERIGGITTRALAELGGGR